MENLDCAVLIVGCGPTGVVLANLLGQLGVRVVVLERDRDVYPVPRATHIDEETLRNFQSTGLIEALTPYTTPFGTMKLVDPDGTALFEQWVGHPEAPHGYSGSRFFDQPVFERTLRGGLARYPHVRLLVGTEAVAYAQDGDGVVVRAKDVASDERFDIRASWVVGCDGGRSQTRDAMGVEMAPIAPQRKWLILDSLLKDPADAALLPDGFRYILDPARLTVYAHGIGAHRRWEFQLGKNGETPDRETVLSWVSAFIDLDRLDVTRITTYAHTALLARAWRVGRMFVAGDAAHMMPPSAGQGMCSGIRDAVNLAWKLHCVVSGRFGAGLLDTYERERAPHVRKVLHGTLFIGRLLRGDTAFERWSRRQHLRLVMALPGLERFLRSQRLGHPPLRDGFLLAGSREAGRHLPQGTIHWDERDCLSDDAFGYRFALVTRPGVVSAEDAAWAAARGVGVWRIGEDVIETNGTLSQWLRERGLDFALARPDHQIFATGKMHDLARVRAAFDALMA